MLAEGSMQPQTNIARRMAAFIALAMVVVLGGWSCGPKRTAPPPAPPKVSAEERIITVGKAWREMTQTEGFVNQSDVAFIRVTDKFTLHLNPGSKTALVDIRRNELIRSPNGREFHCKVQGAIRATVDFAWRMEEATVSVQMPSAALPRTCRERGFNRAFKQFPALSATYALRGDQLMAIEPRTLRSTLLPSD